MTFINNTTIVLQLQVLYYIIKMNHHKSGVCVL